MIFFSPQTSVWGVFVFFKGESAARFAFRRIISQTPKLSETVFIANREFFD